MSNPAKEKASAAKGPRPGGKAGLSSEVLLAYWRDSLADADLPSPALHDGDFRDVDLGELEEGRLPLTLTQELFDRVGKLPKRKKQPNAPRSGAKSDELEEEDEEDPTIPIRFALFRLRRIVRHGKILELDRVHHAPLWLAARLSRTGHLAPVEGRSAWLARRYLEPVTSVGPAVGTVDAMDKFLTQNDEPKERRWTDLWTFTESLFQRTARSSISRFKIEGYEKFGPVLDLRPHQAGAGDALVQLYDRLAAGRERHPLLEALCHRGPAQVLEASARAEALGGHVGQMTPRFGLGPAQRRALGGALALEDGEVLAINGPPGTGKTTLIQSLVASLWVQRALDGGEPPIQVVCSANNRAVTNVVDTFAAAMDDFSSQSASRGASSPEATRRLEKLRLLAQRWLPKVSSYGLYLPARSRRVAEDGRYCVAHRHGPTWTGFPDRVEEPRFAAAARRHYLEQANHALGRPFDDVRDVVEALHLELKKSARDLRQFVEEAAAEPPAAPSRREEEKLRSEYGVVEGRLDDLEQLRREVEAALADLPAWEDVMARLSSVRDRRDEKLRAPFLRRGLEAPAIPRLGFRVSLRRHLDELGAEDRSREAELRAALAHLDAERGRAEAWRRRLAPLTEEAGDPDLLERLLENPTEIDLLLDRTLRFRLFLLAGRYWEGRWLLEVDRLLARPAERTRQTRTVVRRRFRRWAMLTPLTIATLYRLPKVFDYFNGAEQPLLGEIDLLIVDEAGQVPPEVGAPVFALARRAVVFGDVFQLEPIWKVPAAADFGNLHAAGIDPEALELEDEGFGLRASEGSLMRSARRATRFAEPVAESPPRDGLWLLDHRRSVPEIIRFCNRLVYDLRLRPRRPSLPRAHSHSTRVAETPERAHPLPAFGWAHVMSSAESHGSSRRNTGHAAAIADWLVTQRGPLEAFYGRPIDDIVGIITPYAAQTQALRLAVERVELPVAARDDAEGIAIGTVHTFQGGERPVILFSPVITHRDPGYFIDRRPNLLNVAVSRAQDAFLVFGDLSVFDPKVGRPSGILAQHLFEHGDGELPGVLAAPELRQVAGYRHLGSHGEHRQTLRQAIIEAHRRILILSPHLCLDAIEADDLERLIQKARARVVIAHSPDLAQTYPDEAVERLRRAGARVVALHRYHGKVLAVDSSSYIAGSFHWLSASRDPDQPFHDMEKSLRVDGKAAEALIKETWREARALRIDE